MFLFQESDFSPGKAKVSFLVDDWLYSRRETNTDWLKEVIYLGHGPRNLCSQIFGLVSPLSTSTILLKILFGNRPDDLVDASN